MNNIHKQTTASTCINQYLYFSILYEYNIDLIISHSKAFFSLSLFIRNKERNQNELFPFLSIQFHYFIVDFR